MTDIAPTWAFAAQALDAAGDPHLPSGVHLRILPSELVGLPVAPFLVYRADLGPSAKGGKPRTDVTWIDSRGVHRTPPFSVTPDNPVTGWLPPPSSGVCCWILVRATQPAGTAAAATHLPTPLVAATAAAAPAPGLTVAAVVATPRGPATVARRTAAPYALAASRIERVVVSGRGRVAGALWVDATRLKLAKLWRLLALPREAALRYSGISNAKAEADARVKRGAPLRLGLHDVPTAAAPAAAPAATPADELARVTALEPDVAAHLDRLLDDASAPPWALQDVQTLLDSTGKTLGTTGTSCLGAVLHAALDPGIGRWLGLVDRDEAPPSTAAGHVIAYLIRGVWHVDRKRIGTLLGTIPQGALIGGAAQLPDRVRDLNWSRDVLARLEGPFMDLWTVACATIRVPPARPAPPVLGPPVSGPWLPATPPQATRELVIPAGGLEPGGVVALARKRAGAITGLNPRSGGRARPIVPAVPDGATSAGSGEFADRGAPPAGVAYRAAQTDWFGRWSGWGERAAPDAQRPAPPRPIVHASYTPPTFATPVPGGQLAGTLRVRIPVPPLDGLPPAARLLADAELRVTVPGGATTTRTLTVTTPGSPPGQLTDSFAGPGVDRAGERTVTLIARWRDSAGVFSLDSEPVQLVLHDPRPPQPVTLPNTLAYAARPDATGWARVELVWTATPPQRRFRVFYADETGVVRRLESIVANNQPGKARAQTIVAALAAAATLPDRAAVFAANADFLTREMFDQLTATPVEPPADSTQIRFQHAVSGSLRPVSFYRVVAVSASNVEAPFEASALVPYAVPNSGAPPQPFLAVRPDVDPARAIPYQAQLEVVVARGAVAAAAYRLRRSSATTQPLSMPVARTGTVAEPSGSDRQKLTLTDDGSLADDAAARLRPWIQYSWVVEVRGGPEPGGGPVGDWSAASAPVALTLLPSAPPAAATGLTAARAGGGVNVDWTHPETLAGGTVGSYHIDVYRRQPGEEERFRASVGTEARNAAGRFRYHDPDTVPAGTTYRVVVTDPIGSTSPPSAAATVS